jgi:hypothetical protein
MLMDACVLVSELEMRNETTDNEAEQAELT